MQCLDPLSRGGLVAWLEQSARLPSGRGDGEFDITESDITIFQEIDVTESEAHAFSVH